MPIQFKSIKVGTERDRDELARLWGFKSFHAIARGVFTPANDDKIILFVTEEKQEGLTQCADRLHNGMLEWEGKEKHANDNRIVDSTKTGDVIRIFYRGRHHALFTYLGIGTVRSHKLLSNEPSKFVFTVDH